MKKIRVNVSAGYDVIIGEGLLSAAGEYIKALGGAGKVLLVSDDTVYGLYADVVLKSLESAGLGVSTFTFPHGEGSKNIDTYFRILEKALSDNIARNDIFVALGGGVTGDITGFAAATFKRGVRYVQLPTTLLAAVDASVGGKTAIDLPGGKNQVGAFHQPSLVLCDTLTLNTLPEEQYRSGLAEAIKTAMIADEALFTTIENADHGQDAEALIAACVDIKRRFVEEDERDTGARMMLNFGHTFAHAIEAASGYTVLHGIAVAAGMAIITRSACNRGYCGDDVPARLERVLSENGLPIDTEYRAEELLPYVFGDKKAQTDHINIVLPRRIGECELRKFGLGEIEELMLDGGIR